jgi:hypothetical protein
MEIVMTKLGKKLIAAAKEGVAIARGEVLPPPKTKRDYRLALKEIAHGSYARHTGGQSSRRVCRSGRSLRS